MNIKEFIEEYRELEKNSLRDTYKVDSDKAIETYIAFYRMKYKQDPTPEELEAVR